MRQGPNQQAQGTGGRAMLAVVAAVIAAAVAGILVFVLINRPKVEGDSPEERIACIARLAESRRIGSAGAIAEAADDPDPAVRRAAVVALGGLADPDQQHAIESCLYDTDGQVRAAAAAAAGACADDAVVDRLGDLLDEDPDTRVRHAAVLGLARDGRPKAIVLLVEAVEKNRSVRVAALKVLLDRFRAGIVGIPEASQDTWWIGMASRIRQFPSVRKAFDQVAAQRQLEATGAQP